MPNTSDPAVLTDHLGAQDERLPSSVHRISYLPTLFPRIWDWSLHAALDVVSGGALGLTNDFLGQREKSMPLRDCRCRKPCVFNADPLVVARNKKSVIVFHIKSDVGAYLNF